MSADMETALKADMETALKAGHGDGLEGTGQG